MNNKIHTKKANVSQFLLYMIGFDGHLYHGYSSHLILVSENSFNHEIGINFCFAVFFIYLRLVRMEDSFYNPHKR